MRKIIQICSDLTTRADKQDPDMVWANSDVYALCDDGSVWFMDDPDNLNASWVCLPSIPQDN